MKEKLKTILITGSGGFIGKNLKRYFEPLYNLLCPRSFELDLVDEKAVESFFEDLKLDYIIHCATNGGVRGEKDANSTFNNNVKMVENLIRTKKNAKLILFGSGAMYDKSKSICKIKEKDLSKCNPIDLYGRSKKKIAQMIEKRSDIVCLNIFGCYGYDEKPSRFPSYAINQAIKGATIEIEQNVLFDYIFIEDLQKIIRHFLDNQPYPNTLNVTPTKSVQLIEIAKIVNGFCEKKVDIRIKKRGLNNEYTGSNELLRSNISDLEFTPIEEGLKKLYNYNKISIGKEVICQK